LRKKKSLYIFEFLFPQPQTVLLATLNVTFGNIESAPNQAQTEQETTSLAKTKPKKQTQRQP
jgi:hypothetical protein